MIRRTRCACTRWTSTSGPWRMRTSFLISLSGTYPQRRLKPTDTHTPLHLRVPSARWSNSWRQWPSLIPHIRTDRRATLRQKWSPTLHQTTKPSPRQALSLLHLRCRPPLLPLDLTLLRLNSNIKTRPLSPRPFLTTPPRPPLRSRSSTVKRLRLQKTTRMARVSRLPPLHRIKDSHSPLLQLQRHRDYRL